MFFIVLPRIHANVGPGDAFRPPGRLRLILAPARLSPAGRVLQHEGDERSQLRLSHLLYRRRNAVDDQRRQLVSARVLGWHRWRLLRQRVLQLRHDHRPQVLDHVLQRLGTERSKTVLVFA